MHLRGRLVNMPTRAALHDASARRHVCKSSLFQPVVKERRLPSLEGKCSFYIIPPFFTHAYWDLETTKTTFKNNIVLRTHLEHSESWQFEDRQMGTGELARAPKASCFK